MFEACFCLYFRHPLLEKVDGSLQEIHSPCLPAVEDVTTRLNGRVAARAFWIVVNVLALFDGVFSLVSSRDVGGLFAGPHLEQPVEVVHCVKDLSPRNFVKGLGLHQLEFNERLSGYCFVHPKS